MSLVGEQRKVKSRKLTTRDGRTTRPCSAGLRSDVEEMKDDSTEMKFGCPFRDVSRSPVPPNKRDLLCINVIHDESFIDTKSGRGRHEN
jgi:hypothetical protein